jgi:Na+/H+-dicarboxylate symporter
MRRGVAAAASAGGIVLFGALLASGYPRLGWAALVATLTLLCWVVPLSLNWQIGFGALLGLAFGLVPGSGVEQIQVVGRVFIAMLKMLIAPMILLSIAAGIARMGGARRLGEIGMRTVALYLVTMALAVATGLVLVNTIRPGAGSVLRDSAFFAQAVGAQGATATGMPLDAFLLQTVFQVFTNPFDSLARGQILPIVLFAILLGLALLRLRPDTARPVLDVLAGGYAAVMTIIGWFLRLAPVGIFALIGHLVATVGFRSLVENLLAFSLVVIGGTLFHAAVTLPLVARVVGGIGPRELFRGIREALLVAFSTSSSVATLPVTTRCVEDNLDVPPAISSFVLPLGATVNMDGTALYEAIAAVFVANIYGIDLGLGGQLVIFLVAMVTAIGAPGIPSAGMVTMIVVLEAAGLPAEAIGLLLTIDRFLDTFRTMANVEGDAVVAVSVARGLGPDEPPPTG